MVEDSDVVIVSVDDVDEGVEVMMYVVLEDGSGVFAGDALMSAIRVSLPGAGSNPMLIVHYDITTCVVFFF